MFPIEIDGLCCKLELPARRYFSYHFKIFYPFHRWSQLSSGLGVISRRIISGNKKSYLRPFLFFRDAWAGSKWGGRATGRRTSESRWTWRWCSSRTTAPTSCSVSAVSSPSPTSGSAWSSWPPVSTNCSNARASPSSSPSSEKSPSPYVFPDDGFSTHPPTQKKDSTERTCRNHKGLVHQKVYGAVLKDTRRAVPWTFDPFPEVISIWTTWQDDRHTFRADSFTFIFFDYKYWTNENVIDLCTFLTYFSFYIPSFTSIVSRSARRSLNCGIFSPSHTAFLLFEKKFTFWLFSTFHRRYGRCTTWRRSTASSTETSSRPTFCSTRGATSSCAISVSRDGWKTRR